MMRTGGEIEISQQVQETVVLITDYDHSHDN